MTVLNGGLTISNSTVSGNTAEDGAGISATASTASGKTLSLESTTVADNTASDTAGGIRETGDTPIQLKNSIVADNSATTSSDDVLGDFNATDSLIEDTSGSTGAVGGSNINGQDPVLGPLQDNGGPTFTQAIGGSSPALNAGAADNTTAPTDQRGAPAPPRSRRRHRRLRA